MGVGEQLRLKIIYLLSSLSINRHLLEQSTRSCLRPTSEPLGVTTETCTQPKYLLASLRSHFAKSRGGVSEPAFPDTSQILGLKLLWVQCVPQGRESPQHGTVGLITQASRSPGRASARKVQAGMSRSHGEAGKFCVLSWPSCRAEGAEGFCI